VYYSRKSYINRNRIKTPDGIRWLTLPVKHTPVGSPISFMEIVDDNKAFDNIGKVLKSAYCRANYFKTFFSKFNEVLRESGKNLAEKT
jgi:hypothetical protein